jgi:hypothetical protein
MDWLRAPSSEEERERDVYVQQLLLFIMTATIYNSVYHTLFRRVLCYTGGFTIVITCYS